MPEECAPLDNILVPIFCFFTSITATISSELPLPGKGRHHILLFQELSPQISSFPLILEITSQFF